MPPPSYTHRHPFLTAAELHPLPYLGGPEDRLRAAFANSYGLARVVMRTPHFMESFANVCDSPHRAYEYVSAHLDDAQVRFHELALPTFERICHGGAANGRLALAAMRKAEGSAQRQPYVPKPRKRFTGPRLYGLRPTRSRGERHAGLADPYHIAAAKNLSVNLVVHVNKTQRKQIRQVITQSITRGINVDDTALRIANLVGLDPRWQRAVDNLHQRMLDNGIPRHVAQQRANDYADELLDKRGTRIARTELMRALNDGRHASWHEAADRGLLDAKQSVKEWQGAIDSLICPECEYLSDPTGHGTGMLVVGIDTPFSTEFGDVVMPPVHPHCRCTVNLLPVGGDSEVQQEEPSAGDAAIVGDPEIAALLAQQG